MKTLFLRLTAFTILWSAVLTSEAQYKKLTHGQLFPYDTGVAIQINQYRIEGLYIKSSRSALDSLNKEAITLTREIDSLNAQLNVKSLLYNNQVKQNKTILTSYNKLSQDVNTLSGLFDDLANKKDPWYSIAFKYIVYGLAIYGGGHLIF